MRHVSLDRLPADVAASVRAELDAAAEGPITVDITTTGRRSGEPRRIEIWIVRVRDSIVIGGTPGRRDWLANLRADPSITVHFKERGELVDVPGTAAEIVDHTRRREIWEHRSTHWYRTQTSSEELIAAAPTVEVHFG